MADEGPGARAGVRCRGRSPETGRPSLWGGKARL